MCRLTHEKASIHCRPHERATINVHWEYIFFPRYSTSGCFFVAFKQHSFVVFESVLFVNTKFTSVIGDGYIIYFASLLEAAISENLTSYLLHQSFSSAHPTFPFSTCFSLFLLKLGCTHGVIILYISNYLCLSKCKNTQLNDTSIILYTNNMWLFMFGHNIYI